jgi:hypothetical protein
VRHARSCKLCEKRKHALSPYAVKGAHGSLGKLSDEAVEAVHRLVTDASRITEAWVRTMAGGPLGEEGYVEIVALVAIVTALDTFDHALGRDASCAGACAGWIAHAASAGGSQTQPRMDCHGGSRGREVG